MDFIIPVRIEKTQKQLVLTVNVDRLSRRKYTNPKQWIEGIHTIQTRLATLPYLIPYLCRTMSFIYSTEIIDADTF